MSVNCLNTISYAASFTQGDRLTSSTKVRLEQLGINPETVQSESQARALIAQAEAAQKQQQNHEQQGGNSSQQQLMSEAKTLASAVGASVSSQDTLKDIIGNISEKIQAMKSSNAKLAGEYQNKLTEIAQRANVIVNIQQNIFDSMNMISVSNKLILGL